MQPASENSIVQRYGALLKEFADLFEPSSYPVKIQNLPFKHSIVTSSPPVADHPPQLTGERLAVAKEAFHDLLKKGIIRPSNSQWTSPLHLVPKSNSTWCFTGDYRRLNPCIVPDMYPLPIIEDLLQESPGNVFSTVDLQKAFYQIPVAEKDIEKTAVTTPFGLFEFLETSLGLRNSAQFMQRTMNHILPKIQAPLHELLKGLKNKKSKLKWTSAASEAFEQCKESIVEATRTTFLCPNAPLALRIDASDEAIGAALEQQDSAGFWHSLGFFSKKLDATQCRYSTYDRELLAISTVIKYFERILKGPKFTTYTDHKLLIYATLLSSDPTKLHLGKSEALST
uniref:Reverse transcriptase/retrotransposon-derived protein RNase H-like domain-containing protein n=1 Tax=Trichogramma kaykai TaxID=54128 RepID=A0ABD2X6S9_9HYME